MPTHPNSQTGTPSQLKWFSDKLLNQEIPYVDWIDAKFQQNFNNKNNFFSFFKNNNYTIENNLICNRLTTMNGKFNFGWVFKSFDSYKLKCKQTFL